MSATQLLWLATGEGNVQAQALYSLYSALAFRCDTNVTLHVHTDRPQAYQRLATLITIHALDSARVTALHGAAGLPYRMKLALLIETMRTYPAACVMFLDADTFFYREFASLLEYIDQQNAVMHKREWHVATAATGQMRRFRRNLGRVRFRGAAVELAVEMWNSGVIGVHGSRVEILEEALQFADAVWTQYPKPFVEQFAVSSYLQSAGIGLHPAEDFVFHYWYQKADYQKVIEERLARWRNLPIQSALDEIRQNRIALPPPPRKLSLWEKMKRERIGGPDSGCAWPG